MISRCQSLLADCRSTRRHDSVHRGRCRRSSGGAPLYLELGRMTLERTQSSDFSFIGDIIQPYESNQIQPIYRDFRDGDVRHSQASIDKVSLALGYSPQYTLKQGLEECIKWYINSLTISNEAK